MTDVGVLLTAILAACFSVRARTSGILTDRPRTGFKAVQGSRFETDEVFAVEEPVTATVLPDVANFHRVARLGDYRVRIEGAGVSGGLVDPVHGLPAVVDDTTAGADANAVSDDR